MLPNRLKFKGILCSVDEPSTNSPCGARGHCVKIPKEKAKQAIKTLIGQAVSFKQGFDRHDASKKIGVITHASIRGKKIHVMGHLWDRDLPSEICEIQAAAEKLGMSYEAVGAYVADMRAEVWEIDPVCFTGVGLILRDLASYRCSEFEIIREGEK